MTSYGLLSIFLEPGYFSSQLILELELLPDFTMTLNRESAKGLDNFLWILDE
jgi:hypothetical protein